MLCINSLFDNHFDKYEKHKISVLADNLKYVFYFYMDVSYWQFVLVKQEDWTWYAHYRKARIF